MSGTAKARSPVTYRGRRGSRSSRLLGDESGVAMTELALVLPLLLVLLIGMVDFGKAINYWIDETHLANSGSRWAVVNYNPGDPAATGVSATKPLQAYIRDQADTAELRGTNQGTQQNAHAAQVNICFYRASDGAITTTPAVGDTVKVTVKYRYDWSRFLGAPLPVIGAVLAKTATTIGSSSAMRLETIPTHYDTVANTGGVCPSSA
jgi:Flp pilus assembly protein TadG